MKVLKKGDTTPKPPWWLGKQLTCRGCACEFELEAGDKVVQEKRPDGSTWVECPTCKGRTVILSGAPR